jgi:hypothetical protein
MSTSTCIALLEGLGIFVGFIVHLSFILDKFYSDSGKSLMYLILKACRGINRWKYLQFCLNVLDASLELLKQIWSVIND